MFGIATFSGVNNSIFKRNNTFKNQYGISLRLGNTNKLISNQCIGNELNGLRLYTENNTLVKNNISYFNGECGIIEIDNSFDNRFVSNYTDSDCTQF